MLISARRCPSQFGVRIWPPLLPPQGFRRQRGLSARLQRTKRGGIFVYLPRLFDRSKRRPRTEACRASRAFIKLLGLDTVFTDRLLLYRCYCFYFWLWWRKYPLYYMKIEI